MTELPTALPVAGHRRRRFDRNIGACLGGMVLGAGGCLFGASMSYQHPLAVAASMIWWGIYFGCLGLSIGSLVGLGAEQTPTPSQASDDAGKQ
jgi:hypothetical protein